MPKRFNYTGTCIPEKHYMVDMSRKIARIIQLIEDEEYFTINRPRQYGKSTTIYLLAKKLRQNPEYLVIKTSFEGIGDTVFESESLFCKTFTELVADAVASMIPEPAQVILEQGKRPDTLKSLSRLITRFINETGKKVVLVIDEVDQTSNNELFLKFLGMLRNKYLSRNEGEDTTFQSVILAGVHDVKTLKLKIRPDTQQKYNSPWNIAIDFPVDLSFSSEDIMTMLTGYAEDKKIVMDIRKVSEKLFYYTSGYPFLVSKLCYIIDNTIMKNKAWSLADVEEAVKLIILEDNTNFKSMIKNLENNPKLYTFIKRITLNNEEIPLVKTDPVISLGITYGILKDKAPGICEINNHIYSQLIYDHMMMGLYREDSLAGTSDYNFKSNFIKPDLSLNFEKVLQKFQEFMKEQFSDKDTKFLEKNGRLVFLAFIKLIINGKGYDFKEVQISEEKRLDVVITYESHKYIVELKIWYGLKKHQTGITQLADYLEKQECKKGYLIIFDFRNKKTWKQEWIGAGEKDIFAVWV